MASRHTHTCHGGMCYLYSDVCSSPDVSGARGRELAWVLRGETDSVDVLGKGLAAEHCALLLPVPHSQHEVRMPSHGCQQVSIRAEVHVAVHFLCPFCCGREKGRMVVGGGDRRSREKQEAGREGADLAALCAAPGLGRCIWQSLAGGPSPQQPGSTCSGALPRLQCPRPQGCAGRSAAGRRAPVSAPGSLQRRPPHLWPALPGCCASDTRSQRSGWSVVKTETHSLCL